MRSLLLIAVAFLASVVAWGPIRQMRPGGRTSFHAQQQRARPLMQRSLAMQQRDSSGGGGSTKIDNRTKQQIQSKMRDEIEKDWRLILHDDTLHTIQEVCQVKTSITYISSMVAL
jgi:hypothetical protein